jgi:hypothetical protein
MSTKLVYAIIIILLSIYWMYVVYAWVRYFA